MQTDERAIRELVGTWMSATKAGDIDAVLALMTNDVVFLTPGAPPMTGKEAFASAARGQGKGQKPQFEGTSEIQEIQVLGDWAYMWTKLTVVASPPGGAPTKRAGNTLSILRKQDGRWLRARDANMLAPAS